MANSSSPRWVTFNSAQNKAKTTAEVRLNVLHLVGDIGFAPFCRVDSPEWFVWLDTAVAFRYQSTARILVHRSYSCAASPISVRKETRRNSSFWYAYLRCNGYLHKRYVGRSSALTAIRLDEIAMELTLG